jgi:hypothetical protein
LYAPGALRRAHTTIFIFLPNKSDAGKKFLLSLGHVLTPNFAPTLVKQNKKPRGAGREAQKSNKITIGVTGVGAMSAVSARRGPSDCKP